MTGEIMSHKRIAILGGGPASTYIHAACRWLHDEHSAKITWTIFADKLMSAPNGAFWLRSVPGYTNVKTTNIYLRHLGTSEEYIRKQWGNIKITAEASSFGQDRVEVGYSPEYLSLLQSGADVVSSGPISDEQILRYANEFDIVFLTFMETSVRDKLWNQNKLVKVPVATVSAIDSDDKSNINWVMYNGTTEGSVVRASKLFGKIHLEYPPNHIVDMDALGFSAVLTTFPDLHPSVQPLPFEMSNRIFRLSRYAQCNRHMLLEDVFNMACAKIRELI